MATVRWLGRQKNKKQVNTITPASVAATNTFTVTINGKSITYTAVDTLVATVTAGLVALLTASDVPEEFKEITWTDSVTLVTATANEAGKPFTQTSSAAGGTATNVTATTTANVSQNDVNDGVNWSTGAVPAATDTIVVENTSSSLLWNLEALAANTYAELRILSTFTGTIGLPQDNGNYNEYRPLYFKAGFTLVNIGQGDGQGSQRIRIDGAAVASTVAVFSTGQSADAGLPAVLWKGTATTNILEAYGNAQVGVGLLAGEAAAILTLSVAGSAQVRCGPSVTLSAANSTTKVGGRGAQLTTDSALVTATVTKEGGTHTLLSGNVTTNLQVHGGKVSYRGAGTITLAEVRDGGELTFADDATARTITTLNLYSGAVYRDPFQSVTWTNAVFIETSLDKITLDLGSDFRLQRS